MQNSPWLKHKLRAHFKAHRFETSVATITDITDKGGYPPFKGDVVHGGGQRDVTPGVGAPLRRGDSGDGGDEVSDRPPAIEPQDPRYRTPETTDRPDQPRRGALYAYLSQKSDRQVNDHDGDAADRPRPCGAIDRIMGVIATPPITKRAHLRPIMAPWGW